ncbi:15979_t:CDS:1, partial [Cetraspora pellucida]
NELKKKVFIKVTKQDKIVPELLTDNDKNLDIFFDEGKENKQKEDLNEELKEIIIEKDKESFLEKFFDFAIYEKDQEALENLIQ